MRLSNQKRSRSTWAPWSVQVEKAAGLNFVHVHHVGHSGGTPSIGLPFELGREHEGRGASLKMPTNWSSLGNAAVCLAKIRRPAPCCREEFLPRSVFSSHCARFDVQACYVFLFLKLLHLIKATRTASPSLEYVKTRFSFSTSLRNDSDESIVMLHQMLLRWSVCGAGTTLSRLPPPPREWSCRGILPRPVTWGQGRVAHHHHARVKTYSFIAILSQHFRVPILFLVSHLAASL